MWADDMSTLAEPPGQALPQTRLRGAIDFDHIDRGAVPGVDVLVGGSHRLAAPGLELTLASGIDWHCDERVVVVLYGRPTRGGLPVRASELASASVADAGAVLPLGGRFAAVVIDRARRLVNLQTDRFGVWPLCWSRSGTRLSFADRADAVATDTGAGIDLQSLHDYVYFHMIPSPRTVFQGVERVEPATAVRISRDGATVISSWQPRFSKQRVSDAKQLHVQFRDAIARSVKAEVADEATGCFLSGGTDSSTVAGTLKRVTGQAATFSIGFDASGYDEMEYARIAARHFGTAHHEHYVTPAELVAAIPQVAAHYDQPFGNSSAVPAYICASLARDHGVRRLLAGDGGDELFGGNTRYARQKVFEAWWAVPAAARAIVAPVAANDLTRRIPLLKKVASYVDQASVPMPARMETYNLLERFGREQVFTASFLSAVDTHAPVELQSAVYARHQTDPFVDRMLAYDWRFTLADNDLPKVTGTTRLAGVDVGYPLLADALVDVSTRLGPSDKVHGLRLRHFFKEALADFLPPEIIAKKKHGFGLPVGPWLVRDAAFRELARASLDALASRGLIRATLVDDLFSRRLEEHAGYYGEMVWILMMLEHWLAARAPAWKLS